MNNLKHNLIPLALVFLAAFALRFYDCTNPAYTYIDEAPIAQSAVHYWQTGQFEPAHWEHPPLKQIITYIFLHLFGDNPYGWRVPTILFGSATAALTYLLALGATSSRKTALLAGMLIATDPMHVMLSRHAFEEIYASSFFLAAVVLLVWHKQRSTWLMLSALFVGCAMATKWYYFPAWFLLYLYALHLNNNYRSPRNFIFITCSYLLIPFSVYTLTFYKWFGRGYFFNEFTEFVTNVFSSIQQYTAGNYNTGLIFISHMSAGEWFTRSVVVGNGHFFEDGTGEFILASNNLPVWILIIPSIIVILIIAARRKSLPLALPAMLFCCTYMLYLFVKRPAFLYSTAPLLPYAFTAVAFTIFQSAERFGVKIYYAAFALILAWNLYLYPLATHKRVDVAPYRFILSSKDIMFN